MKLKRSIIQVGSDRDYSIQCKSGGANYDNGDLDEQVAFACSLSDAQHLVTLDSVWWSAIPLQDNPSLVALSTEISCLLENIPPAFVRIVGETADDPAQRSGLEIVNRVGQRTNVSADQQNGFNKQASKIG